MNYKNGRSAKTGDKVLVPNGNYTFVGIVASIQLDATSCNIQVIPLLGGHGAQSATSGDCIHLDDIVAVTAPNSEIT